MEPPAEPSAASAPRPWGYCISLNLTLFLVAAGVAIGACIQAGAVSLPELGFAIGLPLGVFALMQICVTLVPGLWLAHGTALHGITFPILHGVLLTTILSLLKTSPLSLMTRDDFARTDLFWMDGRMIIFTTLLQILIASLFLGAWRHRG